MDVWIDLATAVILRLLKTPRERIKYLNVLAKIFVAIEETAAIDENLTNVIRMQRER